ncbi:hypothetical protein [Rhizobium sp. AC44/96]|uniref:hypothetical protein n=1 Tax=Rhizobium sp. AC44/96 TaxID=1841654 RepID=UPI001FCD13DB|nr:hypothetical protein [Rhizobium sp. AC44/96]
MDPAERMVADAKLPSIVGYDHYIANQAMMADGAPNAGFGKRADNAPVKDVDTIFRQIGEKRNLVGKPTRLACVQARQKGRVHLTVFQKGEGGVIENIVLIVSAQQGQKIQPGLEWCRAKGAKMRASNMRRMKIPISMSGTGIVNGHVRGRNQTGMQHGSILGMKAIQSLRQEPDDLAFGNFDADIVEQGRQSLRRHLSMAVEHQAEPSQIGTVSTLNSCWQRRGDHVSIRRQPAFASIADHVGPQDQIPNHAIFIAC